MRWRSLACTSGTSSLGKLVYLHEGGGHGAHLFITFVNSLETYFYSLFALIRLLVKISFSCFILLIIINFIILLFFKQDLIICWISFHISKGCCHLKKQFNLNMPLLVKVIPLRVISGLKSNEKLRLPLTSWAHDTRQSSGWCCFVSLAN